MKNRKIPIHIRKLEALLRRLPPEHAKRREIEEQLARRMAGYRGEQSLDYYLGFLQDYFILQDLRLPNGDYHFQLDAILISPYFILILEVKNISGTLIFDDHFKQLIRVTPEKEEGFPDPILQVERHREQLRSWLLGQKFEKIPIETLVVISYPNTVIKNTLLNLASHLSEKVIHSGHLLTKIKSFETLHRKPLLNPQHIKKISKKLLMSHTLSNPAVLKQFQIQPHEILTGVQCPQCSSLPMVRLHAKWICPTCGSLSRDAHFSALNDYKLLVDLTISNRELKDFLHLSSIYASSRILQSMNLPYSGSYKNRRYMMSLDD
ncbi:nuclease-related domain-containing protein [Fictibacillus fluitans]|uniref:Nuclease-related domain-containing protein n=1 Tax=Fictibacillus fluitans TaxID=3058422 RepID=A0ABT8HTN2_9BACL|nr:nuclease-related domain-containing protein [Fictibacillus sp. NE201]MDN4524125.1 nuclease-related domain-containing protein [Fictibacillus sp. NE201]